MAEHKNSTGFQVYATEVSSWLNISKLLVPHGIPATASPCKVQVWCPKPTLWLSTTRSIGAGGGAGLPPPPPCSPSIHGLHAGIKSRAEHRAAPLCELRKAEFCAGSGCCRCEQLLHPQRSSSTAGQQRRLRTWKSRWCNGWTRSIVVLQSRPNPGFGRSHF